MAHIPYGYEIADGKAKISAEQADKLRRFFSLYLEGFSIRRAGINAGIDLDHTTLGRILRSPVYLGTDYYPQIISSELYEAVINERARRCQEKGAKAVQRGHKVLPVQIAFTQEKAEVNYPDPVQNAAYLYSLIRSLPSSDSEAGH